MIQVEVTEEFDSWLKALRDLRAKERVFERIRRLRGGNFGDVKMLGQGLSELRISHGPGYRLYFTQRGTALVILLCGGDKSTQRRDIARAFEMVKRRSK
ncbi:MAG: type II toxin-antitoxin system RelE/ParE family toxin [Rhodospirillaceae bacterium]|nr:type II toxin-antitoxin system RelE/ParE family toxin [Rhodospirillaceae bacterium]